jgi:glycosyltransferase involved in cell wall biosynthesis
MPFFTIIIPTFNRADKLRKTIESVIQQSFKDFELLIMDDGSVDHTKKVVTSFMDDRIKYSWANNSGGPATPRNHGINAALAPWISFLDADDIWYPGRLAEVAEAIARFPEIDIFCHNEFLSTLGSNEKVPLKYGPYEPDFYRVMLKQGNRLSTSAVTVRTNFLLKHDLRFNERKDYVIVEDYDLWLMFANKNAKFYFIKKFLGEYVIEEDNISLATSKNRQNLLVLLNDHVYNIQEFEQDRDKLWQEINLILKIGDAGESISNWKIVSGIIKLAPALIKHPIQSLKIISAKIQTKVIKRQIIYSINLLAVFFNL